MSIKLNRRLRSRRLLGYAAAALLAFVLISGVLVQGGGGQKGGKPMVGFAGDFRWRLGKRNKGRVEITGKGLPTYGLDLIGFSDPQFNEMMLDFFGDAPPELIAIAAPTSVFLVNGGDKALVAYDLIYDFRAADGKVSSNEFRPTFVPALMDLPRQRLAEDQSVVILPGRTRLISPLFGFGGVSKGQTLPSFGGGSDEKRQRELMASTVRSALAWASSVTVTLDGAFFEDGSFVGPDTSQFFESTKAIIDAQRDLLEWFVEAVRQQERKGESPDVAFAKLEALVKELPRPTSQGSPSDFYRNEKLEAAQELLRMRDRMGVAKAISEKTRLLETEWPVLHKLGDDPNQNGRLRQERQ